MQKMEVSGMEKNILVELTRRNGGVTDAKEHFCPVDM